MINNKLRGFRQCSSVLLGVPMHSAKHVLPVHSQGCSEATGCSKGKGCHEHLVSLHIWFPIECWDLYCCQIFHDLRISSESLYGAYSLRKWMLHVHWVFTCTSKSKDGWHLAFQLPHSKYQINIYKCIDCYWATPYFQCAYFCHYKYRII